MAGKDVGKALSNRTIAWGAALLLVVAGTTAWLLLTLLGSGSETDRARLDALRAATTVVLGSGGAIALLLAARRQRSQELDLLQKERDLAQKERAFEHTRQVASITQEHQQAVAEDSRFDAAQRRITDLYAKAADQLGSDKAPVRLAGLYSLERLAQGTVELRQTVVNLLCAYLRMPPAKLPARDEADHDTLQELEVRRTAQQILVGHLQPGTDLDQSRHTFWTDIDLDLTRATLHYLDMNGTQIRTGLFGGATFLGWTRFDNTRFDGDVVFGGAQFARSVGFRSAIFAGDARFRGAHFTGRAKFDRARFHGDALFGGVRMQDEGPQPDGACFAAGATFDGADFAREPVFDHVRTTKPLSEITDSATWRFDQDPAEPNMIVILPSEPPRV